MMLGGTARYRWLAAACLIIILAGLALVARLTHSHAREEIERLSLEEHEHFTVSIANALAHHLLAVVEPGDGDPLIEPRRLRTLDEHVSHVLSSSRIVKVKVYGTDGTVVYSSDPTEIGDDQSANDGVLAALTGARRVDIELEATFNHSDGEIVTRDVMEGYVPLRDPADGRIIGVFEAYGDVTALLASAARAERRIVTSAGATAAVACVLVLMLAGGTLRSLARAEVRDRERVESLRRAHAELESRVAARTAALSESERRFRDIAEAAGEYLWETDREGRYTYVSDRVQDVLGHAPAELLGRRPTDFMPEEDVRRIRTSFRIGGKDAAFRDLRHRSTTAYGSQVWQSVSAVPVFDERGALAGHRGTASDITESVRALEQIRKLSEAVEQSPNAIIITDRDGVIEYVNPGFVAATGYSRAEATQKDISLIKSGATPDETYIALWETIRAGRTWRGEICNRRKSGELYWDLVSVSPIKESDGSISHYLAIQTDITQRKSDEASLRDSEERMRAVMNGVTDAIVTIDETGVIEQCNPAVERLFGYAPDELRGQQVEVLMPEPHRSNHAIYLARFLETRPPRRTLVLRREVHGLRRDGETFPLELSVGEMRAADSVRFVGVMRDLTDRKRAEREIESARQKYYHREKVAAVGQLAAGILHEVGNPVSAIGGALEQLRSQLELHEVEPGALETVALIQGQVVRLEAIGRDVGRMASPHEESWGLVDVNQLCRDAAALLAYDRRASDVEMVLELDGSIPAANGSADQLIQVLLNLILNAVHACHERGGDGARVSVATTASGSVVEVVVTDNGVGMDESTAERAFDAFFTTRPPVAGSGLGLSLCKSIVEEHGGDIEIHSEPGRGTAVVVRLPARSEEHLEEAAQ